MKSYRIKPAVSRAIAANEIQTLAPRLKLDPMPDLESRVFSISARIGVGLLYLVCFVAAVA
jgi:hypothetical protein